MTSLTQDRHRPYGPFAERFMGLLDRYPRLKQSEVEEMIAIYPKLTILEHGLLSSDHAIADQFEAFMARHSRQLRRSWQHNLVFALAVFSTAGLLAGLIALMS